MACCWQARDGKHKESIGESVESVESGWLKLHVLWLSRACEGTGRQAWDIDLVMAVPMLDALTVFQKGARQRITVDMQTSS